MFNQAAKKANPQAQMLSDPTMMTSMLTKNLNFIVPNMLTAGWVNFFFTGFVVGKVPFPLTQRFRCLLYTSPSPRDATLSRMPSSA